MKWLTTKWEEENMQGLKNLTTHGPFLMKWLDNILHQNKGINEERERCGIQKTGAQTQDRQKKFPWWSGKETSGRQASRRNREQPA